MRVLCFGDIFGKPGRKAVASELPSLKKKFSPDILLANVENLAGGKGINRKSLNEMLELGFDGFTSGNHIWDNREVYQIMGTQPGLIRPANYPNFPGDPCPGSGTAVVSAKGHSLRIINLMGRVYMDAVDCPFFAVEKILREADDGVPALVDMHAETTSEMAAMGWYLDGRVAAVVGTHTHVQTADERILPQGTAFITDVGMTGSFDSVIGMDRKEVLSRFTTKRPSRFQLSSENPGVSCVVIDIGRDGKATAIERVRYSLERK